MNREIGWNGISFHLPASWDVIVKGERHLIIEHKLRPLVEFRWQAVPRLKTDQAAQEFIFNQLHRQTGVKPAVIDPPPFLRACCAHYKATAFTLRHNSQPSGAVLSDMKNNLVALFHFYPEMLNAPEELKRLFESFRVEPEDEESVRWAIEDFAFTISRDYRLQSFSFSLGLAQVHFQNRSARLSFCRLTQAQNHLEKCNLEELFTTFHQNKGAVLKSVDNSTLVLEVNPTVGRQLIAFLLRKRCYRWGTFTHHQDLDKITGIYIESRKYLDKQQLAFIEQQYGIV